MSEVRDHRMFVVEVRAGVLVLTVNAAAPGEQHLVFIPSTP